MIQYFKYIFLVLFLSVATAVHSGACIQDGMNLWRLSENIACSVGSYCEIKQANFAAGITVSGHYKVCENLTTGTLQIGASNVILDLGGYVLNNVEISVLDGQKNIIIRNGTITNTQFSLLFGMVTNVLVENIVIDTPSNPLTAGPIRIIGPVTGLTIRDVSIYNGVQVNIFSNIGVSHEGVILENISCINSNPAIVAAPANPSAVIYLHGCKNLVMSNISLINQFQELNGILLDTCTDVQVDGVSITSQLATPVSLTTAYQLTSSTNVTQTNVVIDSGTNRVFNNGFLIDSNSASITMNSCEASSCSADGFNLESADSLLESCISQNNTGHGFIVALGTHQLVNCIARINAGDGFAVASANCRVDNCTSLSNGGNGFLMGTQTKYTSCSAIGNTGIGFDIAGTDNTLEGCTANNNTGNGITVTGNGTLIQNCDVLNNGGIGIDITVSGVNGGADGCVVEDSSVYSNGRFGILVNNFVAVADYSSCSPETIGSNFEILQSQGVKIARNTVLGNASADIDMAGSVTDTGILHCGINPFTIPIVPPIGIVNTINNSIRLPPFSTIGSSAIFGAQATSNGIIAAGVLVAALDGNLTTA